MPTTSPIPNVTTPVATDPATPPSAGTVGITGPDPAADLGPGTVDAATGGLIDLQQLMAINTQVMARLDEVLAELNATRQELNATRSELGQTRTELDEMQAMEAERRRLEEERNRPPDPTALLASLEREAPWVHADLMSQPDKVQSFIAAYTPDDDGRAPVLEAPPRPTSSTTDPWVVLEKLREEQPGLLYAMMETQPDFIRSYVEGPQPTVRSPSAQRVRISNQELMTRLEAEQPQLHAFAAANPSLVDAVLSERPRNFRGPNIQIA